MKMRKIVKKNILFTKFSLTEIRKRLQIHVAGGAKEAKELINETKYLKTAYKNLMKKRTKSQEKLINDTEEVLSVGLQTKTFDINYQDEEGLDSRKFIFPLVSVSYEPTKDPATAHIIAYKELTPAEEEVVALKLENIYSHVLRSLINEQEDKKDKECDCYRFSYDIILKPADIFYAQSNLDEAEGNKLRKYIYLTKDNKEYIDITQEPYASLFAKYHKKRKEKELKERIKGEFIEGPSGEELFTNFNNSQKHLLIKAKYHKRYKYLTTVVYPYLQGVTNVDTFKTIKEDILKKYTPDTDSYSVAQGDMKFIEAYLNNESKQFIEERKKNQNNQNQEEDNNNSNNNNSSNILNNFQKSTSLLSSQ